MYKKFVEITDFSVYVNLKKKDNLLRNKKLLFIACNLIIIIEVIDGET